MKLSELTNIDSLELINDGDFFSLGDIKQEKYGQFSYLENVKYLPDAFVKSNISCLITKPEIISLLKIDHPVGLAISDNPRKSFFLIHNYLANRTNFYSEKRDNEIGSGTTIHPTAYIEDSNVTIGNQCLIGPNVSILENTVIEDNVIIRAGTVIGTEGFEFKRFNDEIFPVIHAGGVLIHNNVEIQANCCVSKGIFGDNTEIGENTKLDNLIHVAHGVKIGNRCIIAASAMIAGSVTIGDDVWIGPGASISNQIKIGNNAFITLGSVVTKDVLDGQRVTGNFAINHEKFLKFIKTIR